jgi:hypothetical protein
MQRLIYGALAAGFLLAVAPAAHAQSAHGQSAASTWNDSWAAKNASQRALDLAQAEAMLQARSGGFGPANSSTTIGTVNNTSTYNGPVTENTSGATNIGQNNSTTSTLTGSNLSLTISTGQTITGGIRQGADAQVVSNGGTATSSTSTVQ